MRKTIYFQHETANQSCSKFSCYGGDECLSVNQGAITYVGNDGKAFMCSLDLTSGPDICQFLDH